MIKRLSLLLMGGIIGIFPARAAEVPLPIDRYMVSSWNMEDGLPQNTIFHMIQSRDGYLWLATGRGVVRFDGYRFQTIKDVPPGRPSDDILRLREIRQGDLAIYFDRYVRLRPGPPAVIDSVPAGGPMEFIPHDFTLEDREGRLWDFSEKGLFFARDGPPKLVLTFASGPETVVKMAENSAGGLWFFSQRRGLWRFDEQGLRLHRLWPEARFRELYDVALRDGKWILATDRGLHSYDEKTDDFQPCAGISRPPATAGWGRLFLDSRGRLWSASLRSLYVLPAGGGDWKDMTAQLAVPDSSPAAVVFCEDRSGHVWIGRQAPRSLYRCPAGRETVLERCPSIEDDIYSLLADRWGHLWVGTRRGLLCLSPSQVQTFSVSPIPGRCRTVRKIIQDRTGVIHAVFEDCGRDQNTLWSFRGGRFSPSFDGKGGVLDGCTSLFQDREGRYWANIRSLKESDLVRFFDGAGQREILATDIPSSATFAVAQDLEGTVWIDAGRGLEAWTGRAPRTTALPADRIYRDLLPVSDGSLWMAIERGVLVHRRGDVQPAFPRSALSQAAIVDMFEDREGNVWLGATDSGGLFLCRGGEIFHFLEEDGLSDENILSIQEDDFGYLWLSTMRGILRLKKQDVLDRAAGNGERLRPRVFGRAEGMENIEGNSSPQSSLKDRDGRLWFCTMGGPVMIDPARIPDDPEPPPVFIENLSADGRTLTRLNPEIPAGVRRLMFRYTAVDFRNDRRVRFRTRLEGYDRQWLEIDPGGDRTAVYTNLPPGSYRFRVQASTDDGVWTPAGAGLPFSIPPLLHQTWWFRGMAVLVFLGAAFALGRMVIRFVFLLSFLRRKRLVGHYVLGDEIALGLTSAVYKAHSIFSRTPVAVKILKKDSLQKEINIRRFKREGALIDMLDDPHIVRVIARGEHERTFYLVMEYVRGETLARALRREGRFDLNRTVSILRQLTEVLRTIHGRGVVHRDLKPANIMLVENEAYPDFVKLLDFGVATAAQQIADTEYGCFSGTMAYIAPERIKNIESPAGDIYSLGMIAYEMTAGVRPFHDVSPSGLMEAILDQPPLPLRAAAPRLPERFAAMIMSMLGKTPQSRPDLETIEAVLDGLKQAQPFEFQ